MELEFAEILHSFVIAVLTVLAGILGTYLAKLLVKISEWVKSKIGQVTYDRAMELARGIYVALEDKYDISGMGETKKAEMEQILLEKFPTLTQEELDAINKNVWLSFQNEVISSKYYEYLKPSNDSVSESRIDG